jgi:hypothetical protein
MLVKFPCFAQPWLCNAPQVDELCKSWAGTTLHHGELLIDRKSVFQAHLVSVRGVRLENHDKMVSCKLFPALQSEFNCVRFGHKYSQQIYMHGIDVKTCRLQ